MSYKDRYKFREARTFYAEALLKMNVKQEFIAEKTGYSQQHISRIRTAMCKRMQPCLFLEEKHYEKQ